MDFGLRVWPWGALTQDQQFHSTLSAEVWNFSSLSGGSDCFLKVACWQPDSKRFIQFHKFFRLQLASLPHMQGLIPHVQHLKLNSM